MKTISSIRRDIRIEAAICFVLSVFFVSFMYKSHIMDLLWMNAAAICNIYGIKGEYLIVYSSLAVLGALFWIFCFKLIDRIRN